MCTPPLTVSVYSAIGLGWQGSAASKTTMPFLRSEAPSRENTPYLPSSVVITSFTMRAFVSIESTIFGCVGSAMSMAYTRSAMVERYAHAPEGCTHTSAVLNLMGRWARTSMPRVTRRGSTVTTASAVRVPKAAVTVYVPGSSPTNVPSGSRSAAPLPASSDHAAVTPGIGRPAASFAVTVSRTTSPVRTDVAAGSMVTRATVLATTWIASARVTGPAVADTVARPGAKARKTPSLVTLATRGVFDVKDTGSWRASSCAL